MKGPSAPDDGVFLARCYRPGIGPCIATVRDGELLDVTSRLAPTARDICEFDDPADYLASAKGEPIGAADLIARNANEGLRNETEPWMLAPCDFQVIKACGVTFAGSMIERVIEERADGDPDRAEEIRNRIGQRIGTRLLDIEPGSERAAAAKEALIEEGLWSQYLEVGIGPDAEIFTKSPVLSGVGTGSRIGIHPKSIWSNPEPELVLACNSKGSIVGAALGNDVNLRDFEGRSALLLGKSKDNNASCSIGPYIRLFDKKFRLEDIASATIDLLIEGEDGFVLEAESDMATISRPLTDLASQTLDENHAYPDGFLLFCGTPFAPSKDRDTRGGGFTHHLRDIVTIKSSGFGALSNEVAHCADCERWSASASHLMRNLAARELL